MTDTPLSVEAQLAVISTKLDLLIQQRAEDREARDKGHSDHEVRLRGLETWKNRIIGAALAAGLAGGGLVTAITRAVA